MIRIKVAELLGKNKMTQSQLSKITGIRPNTISLLYHENIKRIDVDILDKLCEAFNCNISEVMEYVSKERVD